MRETEKTNRLRGSAFMERYLRGRVIDIGSGDDPVTPEAEAFDLAEGDANRIDELRPLAAYDCVHSSHCLEHMIDARDALARWWRLVRPGGHLIVVVPDEELYEQGVWPSRFNADHKWTFRLGGAAPDWSPVSLDLLELAETLPGAEIVSAERQEAGYDRSLLRMGVERPSDQAVRAHGFRMLQRLSSRRALSEAAVEELQRFLHALGVTVDQTWILALAQIQVVARKRPEGC